MNKYWLIGLAVVTPFVLAAPGCGEAFSVGPGTSSGAATAAGGTGASSGGSAPGGAGGEEQDAAVVDAPPPPDSSTSDGGVADAEAPDASPDASPSDGGSEDAGECALTCADWWAGCTGPDDTASCAPSQVCSAERDLAWDLFNCMCPICISQCGNFCQDPPENCRYCYADAGAYSDCVEKLEACLAGEPG